jgi:hypothetical protein
VAAAAVAARAVSSSSSSGVAGDGDDSSDDECDMSDWSATNVEDKASACPCPFEALLQCAAPALSQTKRRSPETRGSPSTTSMATSASASSDVAAAAKRPRRQDWRKDPKKRDGMLAAVYAIRWGGFSKSDGKILEKYGVCRTSVMRNAKKLEADPHALGPDFAELELAGRAQQAAGGGGGGGGGGGDSDNDGDDWFSWNCHFADPFGDFDFHDGPNDGGGGGGGGGYSDNDGDDWFSWNCHFADPFGDFDFHDGPNDDPAPEDCNEHHVS